MSYSAVLCAAMGFFTAASASVAQPVRLATIGDSLTDEYSEQTYGTYAQSWTQLLVQTGRVNMGPTATTAGVGDWGEPRRTGYQDNYARYSHTTIQAIVTGQHTGAAAAVAQRGATHVVVFIGGNDFGPFAYGFYDFIYRNEWTQAQIDAFFAARLAEYQTILDALAPTGARVILSPPVDFSFMPFVWAARPGTHSRGQVTFHMGRFRDEVRRLASQRSLVFLDMFQLNSDLFRTNAGRPQSVLIGNVPITLAGAGVAPDIAVIDDGAHPHTVTQAVWADAMVAAMNLGSGANLARLSESEMVTLAGLTYGGMDTLGVVLSPMASYLHDFSCRADYDLDGVTDVQDIFSFLEYFFANDRRADLDFFGGLSVDDIFMFLESYFSGCP